MGVARNLMVRVGADVSSFVKGMKAASSASERYKKASKGTASAAKVLQNPLKAAAQASAAYRERMEAVAKANAAAKQRMESVSQALKKSEESFNTLKDAAKGLNLKKTFAEQRAGVEAELDAINAELHELGSGLKNSTGGIVAFGSSFLAFDAAKTKFSELCAKSDELAQKLGSLDSTADILGDSFSSVTIGSALKTASSEVDKLSAASRTAKADVKRLGNSSESLHKIGSVSAGASAGIQAMASNLKAAVRVVGKGAANTIVSFFKKITTHAKSSNDGVKKLLTSIKRIGVVSLGLKIASGIFGRLRSVVSSYISENEELNSTVDALKTQLGQALAPAIQLIIGLVQQLMPLIMGISSAISQIFTSVCGGIIATATTASNAVSDAASSAGNLYGFDQINKEDSESGSGSSSSTSSGSSTMFSGIAEKIAAELNKIKDLFTSGQWGEALNVMLDDILAFVPSLEAALLTVTDTVNGFTEDLFGMFTADGVKEKVGQLGANLTDALNETVSSLNWGNLGAAIGSGLDLALEFTSTAITNFDWFALGEDLADGINNILSSVEWENLGITLGGYVMAWVGAIGGAVSEFDWAALGADFMAAVQGMLDTLDWGTAATAVSDAATGILDCLNGAIDTFDWAGFGSYLWESIVDIVTGIDWAGIISKGNELCGELIGGILSFLLGLIEGVGSDVWDAVSEGWDKFTKKLADCGNPFELWLDVVGDLASWVWDNICSPFIGGILSGLGIDSSSSTVMLEFGKDIMLGLKDGILSMVSTVTGVFSTLWEKIKGVFRSVADWFGGVFSDAWEAVKKVFSTGGAVFTGITDGILEGLKTVVNALIKGINNVIKTPFNGINTALNKIKKIEILGVKPFSSIATISIPQIPYLAQGAVIPPNKEFAAILGDQSNGKNLELPESLLREIVQEETASNNAELLRSLQPVTTASTSSVEAVQPADNNAAWAKEVAALVNSTSSGNAQPLTVQIYVAGKKVAEETITEINRITKTTGKCPIYV